MNFIDKHLNETALIAQQLDRNAIAGVIAILRDCREKGGRLFFLGVGGSAANCGHAVNDFRKLTAIEAYAPTDNVSELTARINDEGWSGAFAAWLKTSRLRADDVIFILSVGGGDAEREISTNLIEAIRFARTVGARVVGIVGREEGYTAQEADACVVIPTVNDAAITPHSEAFQAVVWHTMVSHPDLKAAPTKW